MVQLSGATGDLLKRAIGSLDEYDKALSTYSDKRAAATAPGESAMKGTLAQMKSVASKMPKGVPAAPKLSTTLPTPPTPPNINPMDVFKQLAPALAVLGSLKARRPMTAALSTAASAMESYKQGKMDQYEKQREQWKDQATQALQQNQMELDQYRAVMESTKGNIQALQAELSALGSVFQDEHLMSMIAAGNVDKSLEILDKRQDATTRMLSAIGKLSSSASIKNEQAVGEIDNTIEKLERMKKLVKADPSLVGAKGMAKRGVQRIEGQLKPGQGSFPEATKFQSEVETLKTGLSSSILRTRYFSGPAQKKLDELVEGLGRFDDPQTVVGNFDVLIDLLKNKRETLSGQESDAQYNSLEDLQAAVREDPSFYDEAVIIAKEKGWVQ